jgi:hypothetical protein
VQREPQTKSKLFSLASTSLDADDPEVAVSAEARRVYQSKQSVFERILPFKTARFIDRNIALALSIVSSLFVLQYMRFFPSIYSLMMNLTSVQPLHNRLSLIDLSVRKSASPQVLNNAREELHKISVKIDLMRYRSLFRLPIDHYLKLNEHIELVQKRLDKSKSGSPPAE